ncbi:hypothetical protein CC78DRAFT_422505, partial [Lojkania enalia]
MGTPYAPAVLGVAVMLTVLDIATVFLRLYNRKRLRQDIQADDWLMIPSMLLILGLLVVLVYGIHRHALGYASPLVLQARDYGAEQITEMAEILSLTAKMEYSFLVIVAPALGFVKVSIIAFYRRIFVVEKHSFRDARNFFMILMIVLISLWSAGFCLAFMWMCKGDFNAAFQPPAVLMQKCVNTVMLGFAFSVSDFVTDVIIISIPMPFVWQLHLSIGKKLAVTAVFLLGILASISSLIRMIWMIWAKNVGFDPTMDGELITTGQLFWFYVEVTIGVFAACLPTLRGLFQSKGFDSFVRGVRTKLSLGS